MSIFFFQISVFWWTFKPDAPEYLSDDGGDSDKEMLEDAQEDKEMSDLGDEGQTDSDKEISVSYSISFNFA